MVDYNGYIEDTNFLGKLTLFVYTCVSNGFPIAIWKSPKEEEIRAITSFSGAIDLKGIKLENDDGFVFANFYDKEKNNLFIKNEAFFSSKTNKVIFNRENFNFSKEYLKNEKMNTQVISWFKANKEKRTKHYKKEDFYHLVSNTIKEIKKGLIKKIVVSRTLKVPRIKNDNLINSFILLCEKYPTSFVSLVSIPSIGTWLGATPETLLKIENNTFETMALAGTKSFISEEENENTEWDSKDIEEHELVAEYIKALLEKHELSFYRAKRYTVRAGNLIHLRTDFKAENPSYFNYMNLIKDLHPTPAVCGVPKKDALEFILKNELHKRSYYAGFIGPVNIQNKTSLFVNLRCMEVLKDFYVLYVGCGIVKDSIEANEWEETEKKAKIILSVIQ